MMKRPKTHPELLNRDVHPVFMSNTKMMNTPVESLSANKLLVNVTVEQSSGPLRLLLSKDATVEDVIKATLVLYAKEGRKPLLSNDPTSFGLHYSQFCIDCLNLADKTKDLGSRNFFLCSKPKAKENCGLSFQSGETAVTDRSCSSPFSCGNKIQNISGLTEPWYSKFVQCLLLPPWWTGIASYRTSIYIVEEDATCLGDWCSIDCHVKWHLCSYSNGGNGEEYPQTLTTHPFDHSYPYQYILWKNFLSVEIIFLHISIYQDILYLKVSCIL